MIELKLTSVRLYTDENIRINDVILIGFNNFVITFGWFHASNLSPNTENSFDLTLPINVDTILNLQLCWMNKQGTSDAYANFVPIFIFNQNRIVIWSIDNTSRAGRGDISYLVIGY